jgi:methionyl-tRNA formyltransferase
VRLLFAGTPAAAVPSLQSLLGSRHEVVAVLTRPDAPAGRGRRLGASPVAAVAAEAGVEVLKYARPRDPQFLARLRDLAPDCAPIVAYGGLIPRAALDVPRRGWVNLHFSLLPAWRGAAPVQHAVLHGDEVTGASTFLLEEGLDTGPVFGALTEQIRSRDTSGDLLDRLSVAGAKLLVTTLDGIEDDTVHAVPQPTHGVSLAPKVTVEDARVDWSAPALRVERLVRACTPSPGAWTTFRGDRLKLAVLQKDRDITDLGPGELRAGRDGVRVGTGSTAVRLGDVQPQSKKPMAGTAWANGVRLAPGDRLL